MQEKPEGQSAPTRIAAVGLALLFVTASVACRLVLWEGLSFLGDERSMLRNTVIGVLLLGAVMALTALVQRKRPALQHPDLVLLPTVSRKTLVLGLWGLLAGTSLFAATFSTVLATGGIQVAWRPVPWLSLAGTLLVAFAATVLNAAWEEYTFRGWAFSICAKAVGPHTVAIGLGVAFGMAHLFNPKWTFAAIASVALAGFLLSYAMLASRNIALPVGLHVGWNFTQSLLTSSRFWDVTRGANPWLSGGPWGLEASAAGIGITALGTAMALVWFLWRNKAGAQPA